MKNKLKNGSLEIYLFIDPQRDVTPTIGNSTVTHVSAS